MHVASRKLNGAAGVFNGNGPIGGMLALSLLLHIIVFIPFLLPGHARMEGGPAQFIDLKLGVDAAQPSPSVTAKGTPAAGKAPPAPAQAEPVRISELERLKENTERSLAGAASQPEASAEASLGLGITRGYFASIGEGETLRDDIREYYFEMLRRINEKWWVNGGSLAEGRRRAVFYLVIARDGTIMDRTMVESSGNPGYDRSMLRALEASSPLPPLPESYRGDFFRAPLRFNAPLNLMKSLKITS